MEEQYDFLTRINLDSLPFEKLILEKESGSREGFQVLLNKGPILASLTCTREVGVTSGIQMQWKVVLKKASPLASLKTDQLSNISGYKITTVIFYANPSDTETVSKQVFSLLNPLFTINKKTLKNFTFSEEVGKETSATQMFVLISDNPSGKIIRGTYYGPLAAKTPPIFDSYEQTLQNLLKIAKID